MDININTIVNVCIGLFIYNTLVASFAKILMTLILSFGEKEVKQSFKEKLQKKINEME